MPHTAELIAVGTELLLGSIVNSDAQMISRDLAVLGPLAVTGGCLLLMFCSRRTFYPWIISIFTLVLPILLYLTNVYPN